MRGTTNIVLKTRIGKTLVNPDCARKKAFLRSGISTKVTTAELDEKLPERCRASSRIPLMDESRIRFIEQKAPPTKPANVSPKNSRHQASLLHEKRKQGDLIPECMTQCRAMRWLPSWFTRANALARHGPQTDQLTGISAPASPRRSGPCSGWTDNTSASCPSP